MDPIHYQQRDLDFAKKWRILYPLYFDKNVSRDNGRKVANDLALEMPDVDDFRQVLTKLQIPFVVEINKSHPSDFFCKGRVRYNLFKDDEKTPVNAEIPNSSLKYDQNSLFTRRSERLVRL